ncbi:MAG: ABC transporter permease [Anaerolineae bacterium]
MATTLLAETIRSVLASSTPLILAAIGETITEKAGVINLSLDGSILLAAMVAFAVAYLSGSLLLGFLAAMIVGAVFALIVAYGSIALRQDQVAIGFVLTLLGADLSSFMGAPYVGLAGPSVPSMPIPGLVDIPVIGPIFFNSNVLVYLSYVLVIGTWLWIAKTQHGLRLRAVGERPEAAFSRGVDVNRLRYLYTMVGGALVGMAGAAYSLSVKLGWSHRHTAGIGWIALAIVIFGGWSAFRVALGAYFFGFLKSAGSILQPVFPNVATQVFQAAPFALMIIVLVLVSGDLLDRIQLYLPRRLRGPFLTLFRASPPTGLGKTFQPD